MEKNRSYKRRYKFISIALYKEEGYLLSDVTYVQCNMNTGNINIYDAIKFKKKLFEFVPIFKRFSGPRINKFSAIAKNKMKELIEKNPSISSSEIIRATGYDWPIINRYYMTLKKIYR